MESILAALLLLSIPFASTLQAQSVSQETTNESCGCYNSMPSDEEIGELIIAIQNLIDFLESIGGYGTFIQQLQYFVDGIINWAKKHALHEFMCEMFWFFVICLMLKIIDDLLATGSDIQVIIFGLLVLVPIANIYGAFGCSQYDFDDCNCLSTYIEPITAISTTTAIIIAGSITNTYVTTTTSQSANI